jgi:hypothetical protein
MGHHQLDLQVHDLEAGFYVVLLKTAQESRAVKIVVVD